MIGSLFYSIAHKSTNFNAKHKPTSSLYPNVCAANKFEVPNTQLISLEGKTKEEYKLFVEDKNSVKKKGK